MGIFDATINDPVPSSSTAPQCPTPPSAGAVSESAGAGSVSGTHVFTAAGVRGSPDRFRIKIWHFDTGLKADVVDYDNQVDASLEGGSQEGPVISRGKIVIRR